jgi:hypothetical protein
MRQFTIAQTPADPDRDAGWVVDIDGRRDRQYSSQWAAIVGAFVAAHEATHTGEEAMIVMETSTRQVLTFSLTPEDHNDAVGSGSRECEAFNSMGPFASDSRLRGAA